MSVPSKVFWTLAASLVGWIVLLWFWAEDGDLEQIESNIREELSPSKS